MFVRPEQVAALVAKHPEIDRARVIATRQGEMDAMTVKIETTASDASAYEASVMECLKLKGTIELVPQGGLPRDGLVIEDQRKYD
jgi:phenylacetate-CoA ligase